MLDLPTRKATIDVDIGAAFPDNPAAEGVVVTMRTATDEQADVVWDAMQRAQPAPKLDEGLASEKLQDDPAEYKLELPSRWLRLLFDDNVVSIRGPKWDGFDPQNDDHVAGIPRAWKQVCAIQVAQDVAADDGSEMEKNSSGPDAR